MPLEFLRHKKVEADLRSLPSRELQRRALNLITSLLESPFLGQPLDYVDRVGNLGDCRKLYFDYRGDVEPGYRIVYRVEPTEDDPRTVHVIAVGKRHDLEAYIEAATRLGRNH